VNKSITESLLEIFGTITVFALMVVWQGFVLSLLWKWLIVPVFQTPTLGLAGAIGITLIVNHLTKSVDTDEEFNISDLSDKILTTITMPLIALGMGWLVQFFI